MPTGLNQKGVAGSLSTEPGFGIKQKDGDLLKKKKIELVLVLNEDCACGAGKTAQKLKVFSAQAQGPEFDLQSSHVKSGVVRTGGSWGSAI